MWKITSNRFVFYIRFQIVITPMSTNTNKLFTIEFDNQEGKYIM
jgi:hypothetical protein